MHLISSSINLN